MLNDNTHQYIEEKTGITTVDLTDFAPKERSLTIDLKDFLYQELIIREKEFKESVNEYEWSRLKDKAVAITCSVDTIIPPWCFMMIASKLQDIASSIDYCSSDELNLHRWKSNIEAADFTHLINKKVAVRARMDIHPSLYLTIANQLKPIVKTLMYGEAGLPKVISKN